MKTARFLSSKLNEIVLAGSNRFFSFTVNNFTLNLTVYCICIFNNKRSFHASASLNENDKASFLDRVFGTRVEKATQAHSVLLADQQILYELQSILLLI